MDGILAVIFAIAGFSDMAVNDCPTGCLARSDADTRLSIQGGNVLFNEDWIGSEVMVGYDFDRNYGPFQPMMSLAVTDQGDVWAGFGAKLRFQPEYTNFFVESSFQPGVHIRGDGPELGGNIHFRSALGVGYAFDNGSSVLMSFDHRSNGDFREVNPGLETLTIQYSMTLN